MSLYYLMCAIDIPNGTGLKSQMKSWIPANPLGFFRRNVLFIKASPPPPPNSSDFFHLFLGGMGIKSCSALAYVLLLGCLFIENVNVLWNL